MLTGWQIKMACEDTSQGDENIFKFATVRVSRTMQKMARKGTSQNGELA